MLEVPGTIGHITASPRPREKKNLLMMDLLLLARAHFQTSGNWTVVGSRQPVHNPFIANVLVYDVTTKVIVFRYGYVLL